MTKRIRVGCGFFTHWTKRVRFKHCFRHGQPVGENGRPVQAFPLAALGGDWKCSLDWPGWNEGGCASRVFVDDCLVVRQASNCCSWFCCCCWCWFCCCRCLVPNRDFCARCGRHGAKVDNPRKQNNRGTRTGLIQSSPIVHVL